MYRFVPLFLGLFLFITSFAVAQPADQQEKQLLAYIDAHLPEAIAFLESVVNINSGTMNHEGVRKVGRLFAEEFEKIGLEPRWIMLPDSVNRAGHLFAERTGAKGKRLLMIGHLDTVFEEDSPFQKFKKMSEDKAAGPGAEDMKGGDVVILYALKALHAIGVLDDATITVALTGDEEKPGIPLSVSREALIEAGRRSDIALGFEGGSPGYGVIARRSSTEWQLDVTGTPSHSSRIFTEEVGSGAVFEAARILNAFYEDVKGEEFLTFNPGIILGGTQVEFDAPNSRGSAFGKTNVVAQSVVVNGGLRTISKDQEQRAMEKMKAIVENGNLPRTSASIHFVEGYPPMAPTESNKELLALFDEVSRALGYGPIEAFDPGARGAADISFVPFITGMDGLGVYGEGAHTVDEVIDLSSLPIAIKRTAVLVYRLTR